MPRTKATLLPLFLATAFLPVTLVAQRGNGAVPGSLQFVQGQANIDGQPIDSSSNTSSHRQLHDGETLATANGSADVLLAPGALLRIGQDTTVSMVTASPARTEVRLGQGQANISVNLVHKDSLLLLDMPNGQTQVLSRGLYTFNAATNTVRVFNGEAEVFRGADTSADVKPVKLKESHEIILGGDRAKPESFDRETADADLLPWVGPKETQAALADSSLPRNASVSYGDGGGTYPGGYGFYGDAPFYAGGYPYGYGPWGPYGFYGYPFFGVGFGFWGGGFYGGGYGFRGPIGRIGHGGYAGGGYGRGFATGGGRGFAGAGSFHGGGGFGGGGFHGGGGHR